MKKNKLIPLFLLFFTVQFVTLKAQTNSDEITNQFFKLFEESPEKAVVYIFNTNKWMERDRDGIDNLKTQISGLKSIVGDYYGFEFLKETNMGTSYKQISYIVKFDRQPIRFTFVFYKPKNNWQVQNFKFDDDLKEELELIAK